ncbi:LLM class flavin-dependent oxidoreductase [Actinomadura roseirufa]|uniref:LLM class flavin-dependent oxidoreductase n=1 Tax=Actinomadura roseirufa TaxID=2094049 RepID=UPI001041A4A9|nr:LLM class flavin-dependent oxidoreductase [Actinomadura roseirufa]
MRFAISIPQVVTGGDFDPGPFRHHLERAEALGFDSAWTVDQVLGPAPTLGPIETMTYAAALTRRLRLGCAVFVSPQYSPVHLAKSLSTLDQLSGGRLEVGVAIGGRDRTLDAFGVDPDGLVSRFTEGIALMKACWTQPRITFEGRFWRLDDAVMEPRPVQAPHPRIWFGGRVPAGLRRAVRLGGGFFGAGSATTEQFAEQVRVVREALAEEGRDAADFPIAKRVYVAVEDDEAGARRRGAAELAHLYSSGDMAPVGVYGPPDVCARGLREVADAGAELILLHPLYDDTAQMERLAAEVLPQLG